MKEQLVDRVKSGETEGLKRPFSRAEYGRTGKY